MGALTTAMGSMDLSGQQRVNQMAQMQLLNQLSQLQAMQNNMNQQQALQQQHLQQQQSALQTAMSQTMNQMGIGASGQAQSVAARAQPLNPMVQHLLSTGSAVGAT